MRHHHRVLVLLATCACLLVACGQYQWRGTVIEPPNTAADFTLTDQHGQPFRLSDQTGKVTVLFFGFTSCPDICPTAMADLAAAKRDLGRDGDNVQVALITVDPERDTNERLGAYVTAFDPSFIGLRGSQTELDAVMKAYGASAIRRELPGSALGYTMDHSGFMYVIDRNTKWREVFAHGTAPTDITNDLRYLARGGE